MKSTLSSVFISMALGIVSANAGEILLNHDFESSPAGTSWFTQGSVAPSYPAEGDPAATDAIGQPKPGTKCLRMTGRTTFSDGVYQDIINRLPNPHDPAGEPYCFRLRIKVDDIAFVRLVMQFKYIVPGQPGSPLNAAAAPVILAEKIIRSTEVGQWLNVDGVMRITWPAGWVNSPNKCILRVDVGQLYKESLPQATASNPSLSPILLPRPAGVFPSYRLDFISMLRDTDLDGLGDDLEDALVPPSIKTNPDSDGDGLPDKWEMDHGLPLVASNDAGGDPDGDHFSNKEEYWAATDPRDAQSWPGKTANSNATAAAKQQAKFMALIPSRPSPKRLIGHMVSDPDGNIGDGSQPWQTYAMSIDALATLTSRHPAIIATPVEGISTPMGLPLGAPKLRAYATAGGLVVVKWSMWNPWTGGSSGTQGVTGQVDIPGLVDPLSATYNTSSNTNARAVFHGWMNTVAAELAKFIDPTYGGHLDNVVIFRPLSEMNGNWFWFGHQSFKDYQMLWKYIYDDLTGRGLNHLLWCYESAQTEHYFQSSNSVVSPSDYYYPGDGMVDIMSHNLYDDFWVLPHDLNAVYRNYPKIYGVPQAGSGKSSPNSRDGHFDNLIYLDRIEAAFPRMSFFITWDTFQAGSAGLNKLSIVDCTHALELMTDPRAITLETMTWKTPWQQWAQQKFGTLATPLAGDWDRDGSENGLEYVFGTDPLASQSSPFTVSQGSPLTISFPTDPSSSADLTIEGSVNLIDWLPLATRPSGGAWTVLDGSALSLTPAGVVTFTASGTSGSTFLRLRVNAD